MGIAELKLPLEAIKNRLAREGGQTIPFDVIESYKFQILVNAFICFCGTVDCSCGATPIEVMNHFLSLLIIARVWEVSVPNIVPKKKKKCGIDI